MKIAGILELLTCTTPCTVYQAKTSRTCHLVGDFQLSKKLYLTTPHDLMRKQRCNDLVMLHYWFLKDKQRGKLEYQVKQPQSKEKNQQLARMKCHRLLLFICPQVPKWQPLQNSRGKQKKSTIAQRGMASPGKKFYLCLPRLPRNLTNISVMFVKFILILFLQTCNLWVLGSHSCCLCYPYKFFKKQHLLQYMQIWNYSSVSSMYSMIKHKKRPQTPSPNFL